MCILQKAGGSSDQLHCVQNVDEIQVIIKVWSNGLASSRKKKPALGKPNGLASFLAESQKTLFKADIVHFID